MNKITLALLFLILFSACASPTLIPSPTVLYTPTLTPKAMSVDGVSCSSFTACKTLLKDGSVWNISGDWSSSGNLTLVKPNVSIIGSNARLLHVAVSSDFVTFRGFEITGSPIGVTGVDWSGNYGTISDLNIHDTGLSGFHFTSASHNTLTRVKSYDNLRGNQENSDGIDALAGGYNTISDCEVWNNGDDGLDMWTSTYNTIQNCIAHDNRGEGDQNGFKLGHGGHNQVFYNIAYNNGQSGFTGNGGGNNFVGNLSYNNGRHGFVETRDSQGGIQYSTYVNNTAYGNAVQAFANFAGNYVTYSGNSTTPPITSTLPYTVTFTQLVGTSTPTRTPTITPSRTVTASRTPTVTPTRTHTPAISTPYLVCTVEPTKISCEVHP